MWGWFPGPASRISATRSPVWTRTATRSQACAGAKSRFSSPASIRWWLPMQKPVAWILPPTSPRRSPRPTRCSSPSGRGDGHADLSYVYAAAREIAAALVGFTVVVTKSTVPIGTGDEVERLIHETNASADVVVASNPEFLREGAAIRDFKFPDRIVIGTSDERARKVLGDVYRPLSLNQPPLMFTARRTAELIKYAANAFLATKITFINEIADLAEKVGADVQEVARGIRSAWSRRAANCPISNIATIPTYARAVPTHW